MIIDRLHMPGRKKAEVLFQVKQTVLEEQCVLADYVKGSQEQALMQVRNCNLLIFRQQNRNIKII